MGLFESYVAAILFNLILNMIISLLSGGYIAITTIVKEISGVESIQC